MIFTRQVIKASYQNSLWHKKNEAHNINYIINGIMSRCYRINL